MNSSSSFWVSLKLFLIFTFVTGVAYPLGIYLVAIGVFPDQASGSLVLHEGKVVGSSLIGQEFKGDEFFSSRPSAVGYNPIPSGGSNLGPTSADLLKAIDERMKAGAVGDLLFASGSGLDPHVSPRAALSQAARVATKTGLSEAAVKQLIAEHTEPKTFGFLGGERVNVLKLNLALMDLKKQKHE